MISLDLKRMATLLALGIFAVFGSAGLANAQGRSHKENMNERKAARQAEKAAQEQARFEAQRQAEWRKRNSRLAVKRSGNDRSNGEGFYNGNANANTNRDGRYRIYRNGSYYNTTGRGVELLRQAVNAGYAQGFEAGRSDRNNRGRGDWSNSSAYRLGTSGYDTYVDRNQYQYYFRQGFQRGYQDGSDRQFQIDHDGDYQYGTRQGGSMSILSSILGSILNVQSY